MSLLSDLLAPFTKVKDLVEEFVPESLLQSYGKYAHTIVANLLHDAEAAAKAGVAVAAPMSKALVSSMLSAVEQEAASLAPEILAGKVNFAQAVTTAVTNLKSEAATSLVPALKNIGETTLHTVVQTAVSTAIASVAQSPTSPSVPVQAASSGASSAA
jgi:hypothetical protein